MPNLIIALFLIIVFSPIELNAKDQLTNNYPIEIIEVKDGDTLKVRIHQWLDTWLTTSVRVYGIDTPEKSWRGKCDEEKALGELATAFTKEWVKGQELYITNISNDKFGGRVDALVVRSNGEQLGEALIAKGLAKPYFGKKKSSWCD